MKARAKNRILVVVRGHIGDLIETTPALRSIRAAHPNAQITLMGNSYSTSLLQGCPYVDKVVDCFSFDHQSKQTKAYILIKSLIHLLIIKQRTVFFLTEFPPLLLIAAWLGGAKERIGYSGSSNFQLGWKKWFLTTNLGDLPDKRVCRETPGRVVAAAGIEIDLHYSPLDWYSPEIKEGSRKMLYRAGVPGVSKSAEGSAPGSYIVFHPACHWMCNEWDDGRWAELADRALERFELPVVFTGAADEAERIDAIRQRMRGQAFSLAGKTSIPDFINVIAAARMLVAIDGSQTQIALANGVPAVILFGTDHPSISGSLFGDEKFTALRSWTGPDFPGNRDPHCELARGHCHNQACCAEKALDGITVDQVLMAMQSYLYPALNQLVTLSHLRAQQ